MPLRQPYPGPQVGVGDANLTKAGSMNFTPCEARLPHTDGLRLTDGRNDNPTMPREVFPMLSKPATGHNSNLWRTWSSDYRTDAFDSGMLSALGIGGAHLGFINVWQTWSPD